MEDYDNEDMASQHQLTIRDKGHNHIKEEPPMALVPYVRDQRDDDSESDGNSSKRSRKKKGKKSSKRHDDSDRDSSDGEESIVSISSCATDDKTSLYNLFRTMTCAPQYTDSLEILRSMLKKSDLVEVKKGVKGQRRNVRVLDYFPQNFTGAARKLKRYLQRLLQYSAQATADDEARADVIADGPGLSEACVLELEQASRIPLPGLDNDEYEEDNVSQKKRALDLLLTYVILFHQNEQTLALQDLRLKGPMLTGLTKLFHQINTSATALPAKLTEEYLMRGIGRAENQDGMVLLKTFQNRLQLMKTMDPSWAKDEAKHRLMLFTCCGMLTQEDNAVPLPPSNGQALTVKTNGRRLEQTNHVRADWGEYEELLEEYAAMADTAPSPPQHQQQRPQQMMGRERRDRVPNGDDRRDRKNREDSFIRRFCMAPCACCGHKDHPMLSPIRTPDGAALDSDYVCPVAMCSNWQEQKTKKNAQRFHPCPKKLASACRNDAQRAQMALQDYEKVGSGQYLRLPDKIKFRNEVLQHCGKPPMNRAPFPQRTKAVGFTSGTEECHSSSVWQVGKDEAMTQRSDGDETGDSHTNLERTLVTAMQTNGVTTTPEHISYSALHLLLATHVEPASQQEIDAACSGDLEQVITKEVEDSVTATRGSYGCKVRFLMPYGEEYLIPYANITGRILADTGSTTTLINEDFARRQKLQIHDTEENLKLRDVNNGVSRLAKYCYMRLTLTTVLGEKITIVVLAHCVKNLGHDILLGTKDLERYKLSVLSHRGEALMQIGNTVEILPMLDGMQIKSLQERLARRKVQC